MENLIPQIIAWAEERNIVYGSDIEKETLKLVYKCGKLTSFLDNNESCNDAIGHCMLQLIILCRMRNITLGECLEFTKAIKDKRVIDPHHSSLLVFKTIGELAENLSTKQNIKAEIGYLLIYLTALTNSLDISLKDCTEKAFMELQNFKGIMFDGKFLEESDQGYESAKSIINRRKSIPR